jgi:hypothetical protein
VGGAVARGEAEWVGLDVGLLERLGLGLGLAGCAVIVLLPERSPLVAFTVTVFVTT